MSLSIVKSTYTLGGDGSTGTMTASITGVTTGNTVVMLWMGFTSGGFELSGTGDGINTYFYATATRAVYPSAGFSEIWYSPNVIGGNLTITVTIAGGGIIDLNVGTIILMEISGAANSGTIYGGGRIDENGTSGPFVGPSLTNTNAADLMIAIGYNNDNSMTAAIAPWTGIVALQSFPIADGYYAPGSITTSAFTATSPDGPVSIMCSGAVIAAAASGPSGAQQTSTFLVL